MLPTRCCTLAPPPLPRRGSGTLNASVCTSPPCSTSEAASGYNSPVPRSIHRTSIDRACSSLTHAVQQQQQQLPSSSLLGSLSLRASSSLATQGAGQPPNLMRASTLNLSSLMSMLMMGLTVMRDEQSHPGSPRSSSGGAGLRGSRDPEDVLDPAAAAGEASSSAQAVAPGRLSGSRPLTPSSLGPGGAGPSAAAGSGAPGGQPGQG